MKLLTTTTTTMGGKNATNTLISGEPISGQNMIVQQAMQQLDDKQQKCNDSDQIGKVGNENGDDQIGKVGNGNGDDKIGKVGNGNGNGDDQIGKVGNGNGNGNGKGNGNGLKPVHKLAENDQRRVDGFNDQRSVDGFNDRQKTNTVTTPQREISKTAKEWEIKGEEKPRTYTCKRFHLSYRIPREDPRRLQYKYGKCQYKEVDVTRMTLPGLVDREKREEYRKYKANLEYENRTSKRKYTDERWRCCCGYKNFKWRKQCNGCHVLQTPTTSPKQQKELETQQQQQRSDMFPTAGYPQIAQNDFSSVPTGTMAQQYAQTQAQQQHQQQKATSSRQQQRREMFHPDMPSSSRVERQHYEQQQQYHQQWFSTPTQQSTFQQPYYQYQEWDEYTVNNTYNFINVNIHQNPYAQFTPLQRGYTNHQNRQRQSVKIEEIEDDDEEIQIVYDNMRK
uniref:RanBP2-type domain-containing protein n=1 Tax=Panagrolaimus davidi TaxID=227884 RepID=A0A914PWL9_9BILA